METRSGRSKPVEVDGKIYPSMTALAKSLGIRPASLYGRIERCGSIHVAVKKGGCKKRFGYVHPAWENKIVYRPALRKIILTRVPGIEQIYGGLLRAKGFNYHINKVERAYAREQGLIDRTELTDVQRGECYFRLERVLRAEYRAQMEKGK